MREPREQEVTVAKLRVLATRPVEEVADACVERLGGECRRVVDPWPWLPKENVG